MKGCLNCGAILSKWQAKYCSNKCQSEFQYTQYIKRWKKKLEDGNRGVLTRNISKHIKRYLVDKFGEKCSVCKWNKKHPISGISPLEVDHIDGDSENNNESNLRLLCPNCHSLTTNFRNFNKGKGRMWRKAKYLKVGR